ncbi:hypothetical protein [Nitrospirillum pindoramense]|uniref:Uncharacterized protein n=1 Tax=Nitrospirillum amazonense TaxID=28077 RepID=A0A560HD94_9PROT|nr:hypothetical protein [Nitrospirillum amazonense]TWB44365.1 hypothetical protein FBZ90_103272 [Nitrospirillum amazonense]
MAVKAFHSGLIPLVRLAPFPLIALASLVIRTPWAAAHAGLAALLFLWITADSLATSFAVAERLRQGRPPGARAMMSAIAFGLVSGVLGLTPPLRTALGAMPWAVAGVAGLVGGHVLLGTVGAWRIWRGTGDGRADGMSRLEAGLACLVPQPLAGLMAKELALLHLALFRWGAKPDVPADSQPFSYHRDLTPLMGGLLAAQVMEIAVVDVALGIHHRTAALALFAVGDIGFIYLLGLTKSFRLRPVLLTPQGVRVRFGLMADQLVPYGGIGHVGPAAGLTRQGPENVSRLVAPNVALALTVPQVRRRFLRPARTVSTVAFAVDDPQGFIRALRARMEPDAE